ncbi:hypothetical protein JZ751_001188 [Albula glossodonta]|uniref:Uncharacterized protein n=1 Tax=Albula glossodonta TaxID=121402 RepID=A0A8T2PT63_9TELE|nr:hypothetical protein JZ751_001188 [Albula glossodonta]
MEAQRAEGANSLTQRAHYYEGRSVGSRQFRTPKYGSDASLCSPAVKQLANGLPSCSRAQIKPRTVLKLGSVLQQQVEGWITNSVGSGTSWEGDNGDFYSQMDENGIIGLNQAVEEGDLDGDGVSEEEGSPISHQDPPEDQSFHLRDLQDSESTGGHRDALLYYDLDEQYSDSQVSAEDVDSWPIHRLAARNRQLDMTEDKRQEEEEALAGSSDLGEHSDSPFWGAVGQEEERDCSPLEHCQDVLRVEKSAVEHNNTEEEGNEGGALGDTLTAQPLSLSLHALPTLEGSEQSQGRSTSTPALQYLTTSPRFESKAYSESLCVAESCLESPCRPPSLTPKGSLLSQSEEETSNNWRGLNPSQLERPQSCSLQPKQELAQENGLEDKEEDDHEYEDEEVKGRRSEEATSLQHTPQLSQIPKPTYRNSQVLPSVASQCTHKAGRFPSGPGLVTRERKGLRTPTRGCPQPRYCQDSSQYRKGQLNYPLPDFSKVEPRVRFPKGEYKPPKGRGCPQTKGPASERPLVFKSPADIVREVLLSSGEAPPCSLVPLAPPGCTVLQEFRSPQQANVLVHQLQVQATLTHPT